MLGGGVAGSDGRNVGVQSSPTTGSRIMPPGNAVGKKVQEVWKKNGGWGGVVLKKKKSFLETSQSSNQDAELDVAKCPRGGQER